jgi:hypothetical protein
MTGNGMGCWHAGGIDYARAGDECGATEAGVLRGARQAEEGIMRMAAFRIGATVTRQAVWLIDTWTRRA